MERLTIPDEKIDGGTRRTVIDTRKVKEYAMMIYWALKRYEDTDLTPEQIIKLREQSRWIPVDERLPEEEAKKYIDEELNGVGYLYPCLLTYRSPNTERIHVVRFYYDIHEHFFVNAGENICEKDRCIAWCPLPEPYQPEKDN